MNLKKNALRKREGHKKLPKLCFFFGLDRRCLAGLALCAGDIASETLVEAVDTAGRIHAVLLTRPERMGISGDFQGNHAMFNPIDSLLS